MRNSAERFVKARKFCGKNQTEMADLAGVTRDTWRRYEGGALPNGETLARLSELGFSLDWLISGNGHMRIGNIESSSSDDSTRSSLKCSEIPYPDTLFPEDLIENVVTGIEIYLQSQGRSVEPAQKARLVVVVCRIMARRRSSSATTGEAFAYDAPGHPIEISRDPDLGDIMRLLT